MGTLPAIGGKRMAIRPRKISLVHMISGFEVWEQERVDA